MKAIAMILPAAMLAIGLAVSTAAAQTEYKLVRRLICRETKGVAAIGPPSIATRAPYGCRNPPTTMSSSLTQRPIK